MNRFRVSGPGSFRSGFVCLLAITLSLSLAGCVQESAGVSVSTSAPTHMAARPGVSPRGAPVAIMSIEGAPSAVSRSFADKTRSEAASLDVLVTEPREARYVVRGYLSAAPGSEGTVVSYVWDVFDARKARVQRLEDAVAVKGAAGDWSVVDDKALTELAARSAADLAAVLTNMPEAISAARSTPAPAPAASAAPLGSPPPRLETTAALH
jgi:hypothetical protein